MLEFRLIADWRGAWCDDVSCDDVGCFASVFDIDMFLMNSIGWGSRFWCALRFGHEVSGRAVADLSENKNS